MRYISISEHDILTKIKNNIIFEKEDLNSDIQMSNNKLDYIKFAKEEPIPLYLQPWWLDSVCSSDGLSWDVLLYKKGGHIWGSFVYISKYKMGYKILTIPKLTQITGLYIKYPKNQKYSKKIAWEKEIMQYFINKLPHFDFLNITLHHSITNWLPFKWAGFKQSTIYTYVIEDLQDLDKVYNNFDHHARNNIKKALKHGVEVIDSNDINTFYEINKITFENQDLPMPYSFSFIKNLYNSGKRNNSVKMKFAIKDKKIYSVMLSFYDKKTLYTIAGSSDRNINTYGAEYLLYWEMMKFASQKGLSFDFEGSIIERIEKRNRYFGAIQKRYFDISKSNSFLLSLRGFLSDVKRDRIKHIN